MKNRIVTHFYVKEEKKDNDGEVPIYLRITVNGERAEVSIDVIFPGQKKVFAKWFSGEIKIPQGKMLHYEHKGYVNLRKGFVLRIQKRSVSR